MAKSKNNVITHGLSGLVGDLVVFRQRANKTIVADRPKAFSKPPTTAQLDIQHRFKKASQYAKNVMFDPLLKEAYQEMAKPGQSAFNVAFRDFQISPEIDEDIDLSGYSGAIGDEITVSAVDDFKVSSVKVDIIKPDLSLAESGYAVQSVNGLDWIYTTTTVNTELTGGKIIFKASDLPGNETVFEKLIS